MRQQTTARLLTIKDVAAYMGCTPRHVQNLMLRGLPHMKLGRLLRFKIDEIDNYLARNRAVSPRV
jgi:excisionase family DNA binding protein